MTPIDFQVKWSKVKAKLLVFVQMLSAHYLLTSMLNLVQWIPQESKCCLFNFRSKGQTAYLSTNVGCSIFFLLFFSMWSKVKVKLLIFILTVFYSICYDNLIPIDITKVTSYKSRSNCKLQLWKCSIIKKTLIILPSNQAGKTLTSI